MTEGEWLTGTDPGAMLDVLHGRAGERKLRLFVCACCRSAWDRLGDDRLREAVAAAERYADGALSQDALDAAWSAAGQAFDDVDSSGLAEAAWGAAGTFDHVWTVAEECLTWREPGDDPRWAVPPQTQCQLFRCIFGNPFRPAALDWVRCRQDGVVKLAALIYEGRRFGDLPILADALEEAGCDSPEVLEHCRQGGEHSRGCWPVDLVLGRE